MNTLPPDEGPTPPLGQYITRDLPAERPAAGHNERDHQRHDQPHGRFIGEVEQETRDEQSGRPHAARPK